jgi:hypothetical protein
MYVFKASIVQNEVQKTITIVYYSHFAPTASSPLTVLRPIMVGVRLSLTLTLT